MVIWPARPCPPAVVAIVVVVVVVVIVVVYVNIINTRVTRRSICYQLGGYLAGTSICPAAANNGG